MSKNNFITQFITVILSGLNRGLGVAPSTGLDREQTRQSVFCRDLAVYCIQSSQILELLKSCFKSDFRKDVTFKKCTDLAWCGTEGGSEKSVLVSQR